MKSVEEIKAQIDDLVIKWDDDIPEKIIEEIKKYDIENQDKLFSYYLTKIYNYDKFVINYKKNPYIYIKVKKDIQKLTKLDDDRIESIFKQSNYDEESLKQEIERIINREKDSPKSIEEIKRQIEKLKKDYNETFASEIIKEINKFNYYDQAKLFSEYLSAFFNFEDITKEYKKNPEIFNKMKKWLSEETNLKKDQIEELLKFTGYNEENIERIIKENKRIDEEQINTEEDEIKIEIKNSTDKDLEENKKYLEAQKNKYKNNNSKCEEIDKVLSLIDKELSNRRDEELLNDLENIKEKANNNNQTLEEWLINDILRLENEKKNSNNPELKNNYNKEIAKRRKQYELAQKKKIKKEKRPDLRYRNLARFAGFLTGVGLSSVPGVGWIRMGVSSAKLVISFTNHWTKKHPDGKVARFIEAKADKHPKITAFASKIKQKISNSKKNQIINSFVNSMAVGYMAGNIFELITGETVIEAFQDNHTSSYDAPTHTSGNSKGPSPQYNPAKDTVSGATKAAENSNFVGPSVPEGVTQAATEAVTNVSDLGLEPGQTFDLSGIKQGFLSSDSTTPLNLLNEKFGNNVIFDKVRNGMAHFISSNGDGYAWIPLDELQDYLGKTVEEVGKRL